MKIGIVSRIGEFPEKDWKEEFRTFSGKVDYIEIISNCPFFPAQKIERGSPEALKLKELSKRYSLPIKAVHYLPNQCFGATPSKGIENFLEQEEKLHKEYFNLSSLDSKVRANSIEQVKRIFDMAAFLDAGFVTVHGGAYEKKEENDKHLEKLKESLAKIDSYIESNSISQRLCIENLPSLGNFGSEMKETPKKPEELVYCVNGLKNIGIWFDIGHANTLCNPFYFFSTISKTNNVYGMHIHDNLGIRDTHSLLGKGNINFERFFNKLKQESYKGHVSIELDTWPEPPRDMGKHERLSALEYLKNLIN